MTNNRNPSIRSPDFFIFGCERSGSTLLCALLSEHREICVINDSFVYNILNQQGTSRRIQLAYKVLSKATNSFALLSRAESSHLPPIEADVTREQVRQYLDALRARYTRRAEGNWLGQYAERLERDGSDPDTFAHTYRDLLDTVLTNLVPDNQRQKRLLGEKTPIHSHMQEWLRASYPFARTVVLLRHPITNVAAIFKRRQTGNGLREAIGIYQSYYQAALSKLLQNEDSEVTIIRYEDLVTSTQDTLSFLTKRLGAADDPVTDTFHYFVKQSYVSDRIEPSRDLELRSLLDDRQQQQVLHDCHSIIERFYPT